MRPAWREQAEYSVPPGAPLLPSPSSCSAAWRGQATTIYPSARTVQRRARWVKPSTAGLEQRLREAQMPPAPEAGAIGARKRPAPAARGRRIDFCAC
ncbi:hypothetical protein P4233_01070 [Pseudomonas aeruginosa]|nr:hypothetical protein [Pseudomonas aeruginosa]